MADIVGTNDADTLVGTDQSDRIEGLGGDDTIDGRAGADIMVGGGGNDVFIVDEMGDVVEEASGGGNDTIYALGNYVLRAGQHVETLSAFSIANQGALNLTGNELANILAGTNGANILNGGGGLDVLNGFAGDDVYIVDADDVVFDDAASGGFDTVYALSNYVLRAGQRIEMLSAFSIANQGALNLTGNEFANTLVGTNGANTLYGGAGGVDVLNGFAGDDVYIVDGDDVVFDDGASGGFDIVYALADYVLRAGQRLEMLSAFSIANQGALNLTGNEFANTLVGTNGANTLNGGGGADVLNGFAGNDVFIVDADDIVFEASGGGNDVVYALSDYVLRAGQEIETLSAFSIANQGTLNLTGNEFANVLVGTNGANTLTGGGGADVLNGFAGNDVFIADSDDVVFEAAGGGNDTLYALGDYVLIAGQEIETLSAFSIANQGALNLTGNEFANTLVGTNGANTLDGKGGNDYLVGFAGADNFAFTTALNAATNLDRIEGFQAGIDKILLGGASGQPFVALAGGSLKADAFVIGQAAADANDYLIYNSATGALLYDADGNGAMAAVQFATLSQGLNLTASDFGVSGPGNTPPVVTSAGTATVPENSPTSTIVYQAAATDANGDRITWTLGGLDGSLLEIDAVTGEVKLKQVPNFEAKSVYTFTVVASDSGTSVSRDVTLHIGDVNETGTPRISETGASNDDIGSAQAIARSALVIANNPDLPDDDLPSATLVGTISSSSDRDFFSITLQAGEKIVLDVDYSGGNLDSHLRLYGPGGVQVAQNDDPGGSDPGSADHPQYGHNTDSRISFRAETAGTYYFSIESFQDPDNPTFGSYELHVSVGPPATAADLIEEDVDALISGSSWDHDALTFGFPTSASQYPSNFREVNPATDFQPFSGVQQAATRQLLQLVANVSELTFTELFGGSGIASGAGSADLRYAMSTDSEVEVAYASYPTNDGPSSAGGTAWFNTTNFNQPQRGNYAWMGILHETGHALGLKHGHEAPAIRPEYDSVEYTVMTYRSYPGHDADGYNNETWGYPQTLMMYDIAALQKMYGANYSFNNGDSVYRWTPSSGETFINGAGQGAPGNGSGGASQNRIFLTIWDGGGTDTYDLSAYTNATTVDLRPGEWTTASSTQIANLGLGHFARGNIANALLYDNNPASLIENAIGGSGGDTIYANQAGNRLTGGGGNDTFRWASAGDAGTGALADMLTDFVRDTDRIDLSGIDAVAGTPANDAFAFIGTGAFHNVAGELRYQVEGNNLRIQGDIDGNGVADLEILVQNQTILAASDFVF